MNIRARSLSSAAALVAIVLAGLIWTPLPAAAGNKLTLTVALPDGTPAPSNTDVEFLDSAGVPGTCPFIKPGTFSCNTSTVSSPSLLLKGGSLFGYTLSSNGRANVNGFTDFGVNQVFQAWGTSAEAQWSLAMPLQITLPMLNSANAMMDRTFEFPLTEFKIKPTLTYEFFNAKYNFTSGLGKLLPLLNYGGAGTATEGIQATLPGGITFNATAKALPMAKGTISRWTVQSGAGATTYQSNYAMYPGDLDAPGLILGVNKFLGRYLKTLHHEGSLLDSVNLLPFYSSSFLENGTRVSDELSLQATRLRTIKVQSFAISTIASILVNQPTAGSDLIALNILRSSLNHGVPCIDDCCITFVCGSDGSNCVQYGNQRVGSMFLKLLEESVYTGPTPTLSSILNASGKAPTGTISKYLIDDLKGVYNNTEIPFQKIELIKVKPFHNGPSFDLSYDLFNLKTGFTLPVPDDERFSVEIDSQTSGPQFLTKYPPPSTTETLKILTPTSFNGPDFFGKTVKFSVSTPQTLVVNRQFAGGIECAGSQTKRLSSIPAVLTPSATSFKIKTDKLLGGQPVTGAQYTISQSALDGPEIRAHYFVGTTCNY